MGHFGEFGYYRLHLASAGALYSCSLRGDLSFGLMMDLCLVNGILCWLLGILCHCLLVGSGYAVEIAALCCWLGGYLGAFAFHLEDFYTD